MFAFARTLFAPSMALALFIIGFQLVMGLRAATLRDVLLVRLPSPWMHSASPPVLHEKAVGRIASADAPGCCLYYLRWKRKETLVFTYRGRCGSPGVL